MFETAELGQTISKEDHDREAPALREALLEAQARLAESPFSVIILFAGVDAAGKGETVNLLNEWMDPRGIVTRAYSRPSEEERERPEFWRFWRDLPAHGQIGLFLKAWYSKPLLQRAFEKITDAELDGELNKIVAFERALVQDGALVLKFWLHLGKKQQEERLKTLEQDPNQSWRVTERDWEHWRLYNQFAHAAERIIARTSTGQTPWVIVEGWDSRYRNLKVAAALLEALRRHFEEVEHPNGRSESFDGRSGSEAGGVLGTPPTTTILSTLDLERKLSKSDYHSRLEQLLAKLNRLHRAARQRALSTIMAFEGWDAAGKGGVIRRIVPALDARHYRVISIGPPTDEERARHYLWRFWRHLPRAGRVTIFDRSWYGRVLVERVEQFATERQWRRAYAEINEFERQLIEHGVVLVKCWLHISREEQEERFKEREKTAFKRWKLTEEDWRNRERWDRYEIAVHDMVERTSTRIAPWTLVEGNDKRYARIKVLERLCEQLERRLDE